MKLFYNKVSETMKGRVHPRVKPNGKDTTMNQILIAGCTLLTAFVAVAMPNKKELAKAQRLVDDVTSADLKALKAGKKSVKEVADAHMLFAAKAENDAERYLLLQGAFKLYARDADYDAAAEALTVMNRDIQGVPPEVIVEIVGKEMRRVAGEKAPKVLAIFKAAKRTAKCRNDLVSLNKALKTKPSDPDLNKRRGECLAELGDWNSAIMAFCKAGGNVKQMADAERQGDVPFVEIADFWWDYTGLDGSVSYKMHAADLYHKAMPTVTGLVKERAEQRINEIGSVREVYPDFSAHGIVRARAPHVKTVNGRPEPMQFLLKDGVELNLIGCPAGAFTMGYADGGTRASKHRVTISRPFWISKTHFSRKQWMAKWAGSAGTGSKNHAAQETMAKIATGDAYETPMQFNKLDPVERIIAELNKQFGDKLPDGYVFRLPTEAEWEYAMKAGAREGSALTKWTLTEYIAHDYLVSVKEKRAFLNSNPDAKKRFADINDRDLMMIPGPSLAKKANDWGVTDIYNGRVELFLDRISGGNGYAHFDAVEGAQDPLLWDEGVDAGVVTRRFEWLGGPNDKPILNRDCLYGAVCRIVVGPDIVKETIAATDVRIKNLRLANGSRLDMLKIRGESFVCDNLPSAVACNSKITITRPFWISNIKVQVANLEDVPEWNGKGKWKNSESDKDFATHRSTFQYFLDHLNAKYKHILPTGYVFRFPTIAEYSLALKNTSGLRDMVKGSTLVGDRLPATDGVDGFGTLKLENNHLALTFPYGDSVKDPCGWFGTNDDYRYARFVTASDGEIVMERSEPSKKNLGKFNGGGWGSCRLVVGPDVAGEAVKPLL